MISVTSVLLVVTFVLLNPVYSNRICDLGDVVCTTSGFRNVFKATIQGVPSLITPSDPLYVKEVKFAQPSLKYTVTNLTLAGLTNCYVLHLKMNEKNSTYQFGFQCPQLVMKYHYNTKGDMGLAEIDGNGFGKLTLDEYAVEVKGEYGEFISEKDHENHYFLKEYTLDYEPKGNVTINIKGTLHKDPVKSEQARLYITSNSKEMERLVRSSTMGTCMTLLVDKIDVYLRNFPDYEILPLL